MPDRLYVRTVHRIPVETRYPEDAYTRIRKASRAGLFNFRPVLVVSRNILKAPFIPARRKLYLPLVFVKLLFFQLGQGYRRSRRRLLGPAAEFVNSHERLRKLKDQVRGRAESSLGKDDA
ncbi:MAG: hypothetical protein AB1896_18990 [Thermodesulfobacteriota bacterium]